MRLFEADQRLTNVVDERTVPGIEHPVLNDWKWRIVLKSHPFGENGGAIFDHGSGGIVLLRAA